MITLKELSEKFDIKKETVRNRLKKLKNDNPKEEIYTIEGKTKQWNITERGFELFKEDLEKKPVKRYHEKSENQSILGYLKEEKKQVNKENKEIKERLQYKESEIIKLKEENRSLINKNEYLEKELKELKKRIDKSDNNIEELIKTINNSLLTVNHSLQTLIKTNNLIDTEKQPALIEDIEEIKEEDTSKKKQNLKNS